MHVLRGFLNVAAGVCTHFSHLTQACVLINVEFESQRRYQLNRSDPLAPNGPSGYPIRPRLALVSPKIHRVHQSRRVERHDDVCRGAWDYQASARGALALECGVSVGKGKFLHTGIHPPSRSWKHWCDARKMKTRKFRKRFTNAQKASASTWRSSCSGCVHAWLEEYLCACIETKISTDFPHFLSIAGGVADAIAGMGQRRERATKEC